MPPVRTSSSNHRITKACYRCRHRKTKCDLRFPTCGTCQRANVPCVGYDAVEGRERPRSDVAYLEDKVAQLEIELQRLRSEQSVDQTKLVDTAISHLTHRLAAAVAEPHHHHNLRTLQTSSRAPALPRHLLVSLNSPVFLCQSPLPALPVDGDAQPPHPPNTRCSTISLIPRHVIDIMLKNYTEIYLPQAPYIEESSLHASCEKVFAQDGAAASHFDIFLVAIALAVSVSIYSIVFQFASADLARLQHSSVTMRSVQPPLPRSSGTRPRTSWSTSATSSPGSAYAPCSC